MERKIGETFEFKGKTYKVVKFNGCGNCAFRYNDCPDLGPVIGNCMDLVRSDCVKVMFKETENMEIKDNKLTINLPEGMEIDILNSNFGTGVICFKKKQPEFKDGDIKKEYHFKPFDTVVVRDKDSKWTFDFYSFTDAKDCFVCVGGCWETCLPYNDETAHLIGTTDEWKGGEG